MSKLIKVKGSEICRTCVYSVNKNDWEHICDYIGKMNHSRTLDDNGKQRLPSGYCDKYTPGKEWKPKLKY